MIRFLLSCVVSLIGLSTAFAESAQGYYRFPSIHNDTIVFAAEGDLWSVSTDGGVARRLTTHPGEESHPTLSPDGQTLAFTARYEGPAELYTMPLLGGLPTRLTYEAESSIATTWTPGRRAGLHDVPFLDPSRLRAGRDQFRERHANPHPSEPGERGCL